MQNRYAGGVKQDPVAAVIARRGTCRFFLITADERHHHQLAASLRSYAGRWAPHADLVWTDTADRVLERVAAPQSAPLGSAAMSGFDFDRAKSFIAAIPRGRWSSYRDAAAAAGNAKAYMSAGNQLRASGGTIPNYWRVVHSDGSIADGFISHAHGRPNDPVSARELLETEGVRFDRSGNADDAQRFWYEDWDQASRVDSVAEASTPSASTEADAVERDKRIVANVSMRRIAKGKPPMTPEQQEEMLLRRAANRAAAKG